MEHEGKRAGAGREAVTTPRIAAAVLVLVILAVALWTPGELGGGPAEAAPQVATRPPAAPVAVAADAGPGLESLLAPVPIRVQVVDAGGQPQARVPVRLRLPAAGVPDLTLAEVVRSTGADGIAEFASFRAVMERHTAARRLRVELADLEPGASGLGFSVRGVPDRVLVLVRSPAREAEVVGTLDQASSLLSAADPGVEAGPVVGEPAHGSAKDEMPTEPEVEVPASGELLADVEATPGEVDVAVQATTPAELDPPQPAPGVDQSNEVASDPGPAIAAPELLPDPGALVGRLLLDADVPASALRLELDEVLPIAGAHLGRRLGPIAPAADGSFRFDGVAPGLASLRVSLVGTRRTLLWIDELEIAPGQVLRDPRLWSDADDGQVRAEYTGAASAAGSSAAAGTPPLPGQPTGAVDLTGRLFPIEVELFDEFGRRLDPAVVLPLDRASGSRGLLELQTLGTTPRLWGDSRVLAGETELDLLLVAPDRQVREVTLTGTNLGGGRRGERGLGAEGGDQALAFELLPARARALELRLVGWPGGPGGVLEPRYAAGQRLEARLERRDGQRFPWDHARHRGLLDERGRLRLEPADPGAFVVRLAWVDEDGTKTDLDLAVPIVVGPALEEGEHGESTRDIVFLPIGRSGFAD
ncbi:MAG: hypothetical protein P1V81_09810 [Planctomycetota bacterium]|nr:hypothetical protein [Planctomycetota bacterium]